MNRRSFFKSLATAAVGAVVIPPAITFDRCWKNPSYKKSSSGIWVVNPAWRDAEYELSVFCKGATEDYYKSVFVELIDRKKLLETSTPEDFQRRDFFHPVRYRTYSDAEAGNPVHPWIEL
jgi:hypothetical protein